MIQNYDKFSTCLAKSTHFEKFIFIQQCLTQTMWYIRATICIFNNKLENIHSKILSYKKMKNDFKKFTIIL